jgi:hypothetical protein
MSATPVIKNLYEAKALLKMTNGEKFDELKTFSTIANTLTMHEKLMLHGIRYRPNYKIAIAESFPEISGEHLRRSSHRWLIHRRRWNCKSAQMD